MGNVRTLLLATDKGKEFVQGLLSILQIAMGLFSTVMIVYAVYLFFMMYTATDDGKRKKVKTRLYHALASLVIVVTLILALAGLNISIVAQDTIAKDEVTEVNLPTLSDNNFKDARYDGTISMKLTLKYVLECETHNFKLEGDFTLSTSKIKGYDESLNLQNLTITSVTLKPGYGGRGLLTSRRDTYSYGDATSSVDMPGSTPPNEVPTFTLKNVSGSKGTLPILIAVSAKLPTGDRITGHFDAEIAVTIEVDRDTGRQYGKKVSDVIRSA